MKLVLSYLFVLLFLLPTLASALIFDESEIINQKILEIESELKQLPQTSLNLSPWTLGYRSAGYDVSRSIVEITIVFEEPASVDLLVLMPSTYTDDGQELKVFCFPKRFMVERLNADGSSEIVVDHRDADYKIQGIEPQLFFFPSVNIASSLKVTITELSENETWFAKAYGAALGEALVFSGNWNVGLNQEVITSSSAEYSYVWTYEALVDGFSLFSPISRDPQNPNEVPLRIPGAESVELIFDLGKEQRIDECRLWPLVHDLQFNYPPSSGLGFPRGLKVEVADYLDFEDSRIIYENDEIYPVSGSNPIMLRTKPELARYVKLTLDNIVIDYRTRISELALDEIQLFSQGVLLTQGLAPSINREGVSERRLLLLTDGRTTEGVILPQRQWLIDFARRAELERSLSVYASELDLARRQERERVTFVVIVALGLVSILGLMVWLVYLLSKQHWNAVREHIACDIHDDLGANMISVAHSVELVEHSIENVSERQRRLLRRAAKTAHRSAEDTRQIVRLLGRETGGTTWTDNLRDTVKNLLGDIPHSLQFEETRAFNRLKEARRWDLLLFVKEAVNNAIKHSNARHLELSLKRRGRKLCVVIVDDGIGLSGTHLPIRHLESRAKRLKGKLRFESELGGGTRVVLEL